MQRLEYIQSNRSYNQYIDTGISGTSVYGYKCRFSDIYSSTNYFICGSRVDECALGTNNGSNILEAFIRGSRSGTYSATSDFTAKTVSGNLLINDSYVLLTYNDSLPLSAYSNTFQVFCAQNQRFVSGKFYEIVLYDSVGHELFHGIPCLDTNNVVCVYDTVSQTYKYNGGSGNFTAGPIMLGEKYLIEDADNNVYTVVDDALSDITASVSSPLTAQDFTAYGVDDVPASELLITLDSPSVYCWCDTEEISMTATTTALPFPQTIYSSAIDLTNPDVTGIESITATYEGSPVFAASVDSTTWKIWDETNEQWVTLSDATTGMTPTVMADIATSDWSTLISGATDIYIRWTLSAETDTVTQILVDYTN